MFTDMPPFRPSHRRVAGPGNGDGSGDESSGTLESGLFGVLFTVRRAVCASLALPNVLIANVRLPHNPLMLLPAACAQVSKVEGHLGVWFDLKLEGDCAAWAWCFS
jgi:hypothetical protein